METIREWSSNLTTNQKRKAGPTIVSSLLNMIKLDASSDIPDYEGWAISLVALHHRAIAAFYEQTYKSLSLAAQSAINNALFENIEKMSVLQPYPACLRIAQVIQQRLQNGESAQDLVYELQWYIEHISDKFSMDGNIRVWMSCPVKKLMKLFSLDTTDWQIDRQKLYDFYFALTQMLRTADEKGKTDWNLVFADFLERNHLGDSGSSTQTGPELPAPSADVSIEKATPTAPPPSEAPSSIPAQNTAPDKILDVRKDTEDKITGKVPVSAEKPMVHDLPEPPPATHKESPEGPQPEPDPDKDGVKLAERLLAWARTQVQGTSVLKSSLKSSNSELKRLEERFSNLQSELFAAKEEIAAKEVSITALQRDLAAVTARLDAEQQKSAELDGVVSKLQQMNENSAVQAVLGYKAELASALKSIVEDARLPEAQQDVEILSALLADLLDQGN